MEYSNIVEFCVYGEYGLFTDPINRVGGEKCSYQIPTYEALKGVISSVYWKPEFIWYIDRVRVMNQIQMETKGIRTIKYKGGGNDLSYYTYLKKCRYQVQAHFEWNMVRQDLEEERNENKHYYIAKRMIEKGGRRDIFLGTRECQGYVEPCSFGRGKGYYDDVESIKYGLMYHGITYADEAWSGETEGMMTANLWIPEMKNGVIVFPKPEECTLHKTLHSAEMKQFTPGKNHTFVMNETEVI